DSRTSSSERPHTAEFEELRGCTSGTPLRIGGNLWVVQHSEVAMADYATLLRDHVTLKCRSIDRMFFQAYVPKLQSVGQVCIFLRWRRKIQIPSSAAFGKIGDAYVEALYEFAKANGITMVRFEKRQDKEKTAG